MAGLKFLLLSSKKDDHIMIFFLDLYYIINFVCHIIPDTSGNVKIIWKLLAKQEKKLKIYLMLSESVWRSVGYSTIG